MVQRSVRPNRNAKPTYARLSPAAVAPERRAGRYAGLRSRSGRLRGARKRTCTPPLFLSPRPSRARTYTYNVAFINSFINSFIHPALHPK